jgi:PEP-CTERM motif
MQRPIYAVLVLLVLTGSSVRADPITVTSGFVLFTDEPGEFLLAGRDFELSGFMFPSTVRGTFWFDHCHPDLTGGGCLPGTRINLGTTTYGVVPDGPGRGTIEGVTQDELFYSGEWTFHGPRLIAPTTFDESPLVRNGHFRFEGSIFAYPTALRAGAPLWSANLRGGGTARAFFGVDIARVSGPRLVPNDLHYMFDPEPVPEPSTLFLVGTGLAAALARYRRRSALSTRAGFEERPGPASPSSTRSRPSAPRGATIS